ncbi:hypothetical protein [uncultured Bacteroides sp.]|uniref:hypothetical protein n=1 Tax=uncultured Bacteroides sp. TaxID=162156 RepID=UPI002627D539|nr:hypothetical protein [uncultured Bacteroides sp.]
MNLKKYYRVSLSRIAPQWTVVAIDLFLVMISMLLAYTLQLEVSSVVYKMSSYVWMIFFLFAVQWDFLFHFSHLCCSYSFLFVCGYFQGVCLAYAGVWNAGYWKFRLAGGGRRHGVAQWDCVRCIPPERVIYGGFAYFGEVVARTYVF